MRRLVFALLPLAAIACIPHPSTDFDDYEAKTATIRAPKKPDAGGDAGGPGAAPAAPIPAAGPGAPEFALYFGACFSQLAAGRVDRVLRFYTELKYAPTDSGGKIVLKLTPLLLPPDPVKVSSGVVAAASKTGETYTTAELLVDTKGTWTAQFAAVKVPGNANPISGREIVVDNATFKGRLNEPAKYCALLSGNVSQPVVVTLEAEQNICLFTAVKEGDPYPEAKMEDFVCNPN